MRRFLPDASATEQLGADLAAFCSDSLNLYLEGELGSGKTTLVRGFLRGLGCREPVRSPTYTLVEPYQTAKVHVFHFDLYRLEKTQDLDAIGMRDYFDGGGVCLVEWPERGAGYLPPADILVHLDMADPGREARLEAATPAGEALLRNLSL